MKLFNRFKSKVKWIIIAGTILLIGIFGLLQTIKIDVGNILFSIACIGFVYVLYLYLEQKKEPEKTVNISLKSELISPILKINRYKFKIIIEHEIKEKGEIRKIKADELEIKFRKSDHPDIYKWCYEFATKKMTEHISSAKLQYPDSKVVYSPIPMINASKEIDG